MKESKKVVASVDNKQAANVEKQHVNQHFTSARVKANDKTTSVRFELVDDCNNDQHKEIALKLALIRAQDKLRRELNKSKADAPASYTYFVSDLLERRRASAATAGEKAAKAAAAVKNAAAVATTEEKARMVAQLEELLSALKS